MTAQIFKRFIPLFAFFIMFAGAKAENKILWEVQNPAGGIFVCKFIPDNNYIIHSQGNKGELVVRDAQTGSTLLKSDTMFFKHPIKDLNFSEDGTKIIATDNYKIAILDIKTLAIISEITINEEILNSIPQNRIIKFASFYNNDQSIIVAFTGTFGAPHFYGSVELVSIEAEDAKQQKLIPETNFQHGGDYFVQSPDRKYVAFAIMNKIIIFDLIKQQLLWSFENTQSTEDWACSGLEFSTNSNFLSVKDKSLVFSITKNSIIKSYDSEFWLNNKIFSEKAGVILKDNNRMLMPDRSLSVISLTSEQITKLYTTPLAPSWDRGWNTIDISNDENSILVSDIYSIRMHQVTDWTANVNDNIKQVCVIYPNPTTNKIYLNTNGQTPKVVNILDISGKLISKNSKFIFSNEKSIEVLVDNLQSGAYIIQMQMESGEVTNTKFVKE